jgi:hypothetical protein
VRTSLTAALVAAATAVAADQPAPASVDLVELAVVVTDRSGRPVTGLQKEDFEVKDDGRVVELATFVAASASGSTELDQGRSVVVLLDDVSIAPVAADSIKSIAGYVVTRGGPGDDVSVIRLNNRTDEPYGDFELAISRILEYRAGVAPFDALRTTEDVLKLVANVSERLEANGRRRKAIVCIGSRRICNVDEPIASSRGTLRNDWVSAIGAAARANVSVYALIAARGRLPADGLVEATGGEVYASRSDLRPFIDRIWTGLSHHYLIGYWPPASTKQLHSVSVKVNRRGARVLARRWRGN